MNFIRQYRLVILGGVFLLLAVLVSKGGRESRAPIKQRKFAFARPPAGREAPFGRVAAEQEQIKRPASEPAQEAPVREATTEEAPEPHAAEDTTEEVEEQFDPAVARDRAVGEVKSFNSELATTLRTVNPNARKARLKASQLRQKAEDMERWIESQDSRTDMTDRERQEWEAQREVWVKQSLKLKRIAKRLSATRGTKRKVRILAKEIAESSGD